MVELGFDNTHNLVKPTSTWLWLNWVLTTVFLFSSAYKRFQTISNHHVARNTSIIIMFQLTTNQVVAALKLFFRKTADQDNNGILTYPEFTELVLNNLKLTTEEVDI